MKQPFAYARVLPVKHNISAIMKAALIFLVMLMIPGLSVSASEATGTKVKTEVKKEFYENGNLKKITKVRIRRTKEFDLYNFYKRTAVTVTEFSENGAILTKDKYVTKIGNSGRPCYEIVTVKITYHPNGRIKTYDKWSCDKRKGVYKEYDERGKLQFTRINKNRR